MYLVNVRCFQCRQAFKRQSHHYYEAIKKKWKQFCSPQCLSQSRIKGKELICDNPSCDNVFYRPLKEMEKVTRSFCSSTCSAIVHNLEKSLRKSRPCANAECLKRVSSCKKFCSNDCFQTARRRQFNLEYRERVIKTIKQFVSKHDRIPYKREMYHIYKPARIVFGSWNKAVRAVGFKANKLKFAKKCIANDGHICDSFAEKIIDDWLHSKKIQHQINVPYPGSNGFTVDFKIKNYWIEFFGLAGHHDKYDKLKKRKLKLAKKKGLKLIEIYPHHLSPKNKLSQILTILDR